MAWSRSGHEDNAVDQRLAARARWTFPGHQPAIAAFQRQDVGRALKFLAKAFGLRKCGVQVLGADGRINHAAMKLGEALVMMGRPAAGYRNPKRLGQATQSLYVNVKNVDRHFQRARKAGAFILEEPTDTEYGHRRYGATDPEGHEW